MNEFLKCEMISQVSPSNTMKQGKDPKEKRQKRPPCQEINVGEQLDKLFPPKKGITEEGEVKTIRASRHQANLFDIHQLSEDLDNVINTLENEQSGFSRQRLAVHIRMFDELIRQEVIACLQSGLLLVNVRDEVLGTMKFMEKLQKSCFAYAVTKDLLAQREIIQKRKEISELTEAVNSAKQKLQNMRDEWEEHKRQEVEEDSLRKIRQTFYENQLILSNQEMVNKIEDIIDSEHRWLESID